MATIIDLEQLLQPISEDSPGGDNLRYTQVYDDIKEARRADDTLDRGEWQIELKVSDWDEVVSLSVATLTEKSKDLQIAAWLTEALMHKHSFDGLSDGMEVLTALLETFWEELYPEIDEGDLDYRIAPLEFILDKMEAGIKFLSLTDETKTTPGSLFEYQESRQVGYEKGAVDQYGDKDRGKLEKRQALIEEGKVTAEDFDSYIALSSRDFYLALSDSVVACTERLNLLEATVDSKFGLEGPGFTAVKSILAEFERVVGKILKEKGGSEPVETMATEEISASTTMEDVSVSDNFSPGLPEVSGHAIAIPAGRISDVAGEEQQCWENALKTLSVSGFNPALQLLYNAACMSPSSRQKNRYRLLMGKLCLKVDRVDLARPILEELNTLITDLQLDRWESPIWIGEVLETLYQCLISGEASHQDADRASDLLLQLCRTDITKAVTYRESHLDD